MMMLLRPFHPPVSPLLKMASLSHRLARRACTCLWALLLLFAGPVLAQPGDYALAPGDSIRVQVFQSPDLTLETRISETGTISYPLIGLVRLGGLNVGAAEKRIADALKSGGFVQDPQVTVLLIQARGSQVSVLGHVNRPGRFVLESANTRLSDMLANAGGATPSGDDVAIVIGSRGGKPLRKLIDVPSLFLQEQSADDILLQGGDAIYVHRAPTFYIYGEANRPGSFRIERAMTVMQALAIAGGPTVRGSQHRLILHRRQADGSVQALRPSLNEAVLPNDVIYVRESIF